MLTMRKQVPFDPPKTTFHGNTPAAYGANYYNSQDETLRRALLKDLLRLVAPVGAAKEGASRAEIEALISESDRIHRYYMELAREAIDPSDAIALAPVEPEGLGQMSDGEDMEGLFG
jgi:hypothetical protein